MLRQSIVLFIAVTAAANQSEYLEFQVNFSKYKLAECCPTEKN